MTIDIKPEFILSDDEISSRIKELENADSLEGSESRESLMMFLGYKMGLPKELIIPITEHIFKHCVYYKLPI